MTQYYIKLAFTEKRLFVQTYDCGYYTTLREEPKLITECSHKSNEPVNSVNDNGIQTYDIYVPVNNLTLADMEQVLLKFKQLYPQGYVALSEDNVESNTIYRNFVALLQNFLEKKWGSIAINYFGLFNKNCRLPKEIQTQILSYLEPALNYAHLGGHPDTNEQDNLKLVEETSSIAAKLYRRAN